ncbi:40s ribosomal protein s5-1 [Hordeum vulgare]|nr:40s ribosomal protein s5-1 [Hordeum vulgare]
MRQGMLHIRYVEGPKKTGSVETRLEAMEQQVFKCQGMVERGLNANHMMITEFTNKHMIDANDIGKHLSRLYDRVDQLQGQIYDLQNQNYAEPVAVKLQTRLKGEMKLKVEAELMATHYEEFACQVHDRFEQAMKTFEEEKAALLKRAERAKGKFGTLKETHSALVKHTK